MKDVMKSLSAKKEGLRPPHGLDMSDGKVPFKVQVQPDIQLNVSKPEFAPAIESVMEVQEGEDEESYVEQEQRSTMSMNADRLAQIETL